MFFDNKAEVRTIKFSILFLLLLLISATHHVQGEPLREDQIPEELADWTEWVLYGVKDHLCPFLYNNHVNRRCAWPSELSLELNPAGGSFEHTWQVYVESWIILPGDAEHWPQDITVNGESTPLSRRDGRPALQLDPGDYKLRGTFIWDALPESLLIPADTGVVQLTVGGESVTFPDIDAGGQLWLRERDTGGRAEAPADRLDLYVTRRVSDDIPLQLVTRIELDIAGKQREITLGPALLPQFIPLRLTSPLPARLEADGRLRLQVRPGNWVIELAARHPQAIESLALDEIPAPWPTEEVWVFDAHTHLRLVEIEGAAAVDPRQTRLPPDWQQWPAYLLHPGDIMQFIVIRRGDPQPEPDQLNLNRNLWLDFDGGGYTINDQISGSVTRSWRLETYPEIELGQVTINGQGQFITRLPDSNRRGVEVRRGQLNLSADSRYVGDIEELPAAGWDQDFQYLNATLHLPPGWRLFAAHGVDQVSDDWVQRWTLLDIFLVLITAIAIARLWSWHYGALALLAFMLIWHEPGTPRYVWLHILAAIALLRVLPPGRIARLIRIYRNLSILALVLIAIPFLINQVRLGLYPQLEMPWQVVPQAQPSLTSELMRAPAKEMQVMGELAEKAIMEESIVTAPAEAPPEGMIGGIAGEDKRRAMEREKQALMLDVIDPDARIQTGPGLPYWRWTQVQLNWNGPVEREQTITFTLLPPGLNLVMNLLRVLLVISLALLMFGFVYTRGRGFHRQISSIAAMFVLLSVLGAVPDPVLADIPDPQLREELKARLLAPPECLPECAQIPRMAFNLMPELLSIRIEIHALENVAVPLPAHAQGWLPALVNVDGASAGGLARTANGELWLELSPGTHQVSLAGPVPESASFTLPLPLQPHRVEFTAEGWRVEGVHENGLADAQLQFTREDREAPTNKLPALQPSDLPPFARIERFIRLGLDWRVETQVIRASPSGSAIVLEVPLLPGESVITGDIHIADNKVLVNMEPEQNTLAWQSVLETEPSVTLTSVDTIDWVEIWRVDVSPVWHMQYSGITPVYHQNREGQWLPEWRPWPGEGITLDITRPEGVMGQILTIDTSRIESRAGERATDRTLSLTLRSSHGGQHTLTLPDETQLLSVTINGTAQPIRQEGAKVTLPLTPGSQIAVLKLRDPEGITGRLVTPAIDLGIPSVNTDLNVQLGQDRWVLLTGGPALGPAVLFWGVLIVIAIIAVGLGRINITPLKWWHWFLLGIGLSQTPIWEGVVIAGWLLALGARRGIRPDMDRIWFNLMQFGLGFLTIVALLMLFDAIKQGLLGLPEMQIAGNNSTAYNLNWYQDRSNAVLPQAWILSVPLFVYRLTMLAWALWLAFALLKWLRWGWSCYSHGGMWRPKPKIVQSEKSV